MSDNIRQYLGYLPRDFINDAGFWVHRIHSEDKPGVLAALARLPAAGQLNLEYRFRHKDGTYRWMRDDLCLVKDGTRRPREIIGSWQDITRQKWMERALRQNEEALANFFDEAPIGLLWVAPGGRILRANGAQAAMLGCHAGELFGRELSEFCADPEIITAMFSRLARKEPVHDNLLRLRRQDGTIKDVFMDANGLWENGKLVRTRWFVRDVTRRLELQKEILAIGERVQRRIGQDLHDDLCQRLASIEFLVRALERRLSGASRIDAGRAKEIARLTREAIISTRELSHTMVPMELETEGLPGALKNLATRTKRLLRVDCQFRGNLRLPVTDSTIPIYLYRIVQEAIHNAIKHGKASRIRIGLVARGSRLILSIRDNGTGLAAKPPKKQGFGIQIMEYRLGVLGGFLRLRPGRNGGTGLVCSIPNALVKTQSANHDN